MPDLDKQISSVLGEPIERFGGTDVVLLGDSITQGLGSKKINFARSLEDNLGDPYRVLNLAYTGTTVDFPLNLVRDGRFPRWGGVCVILYGNVDAQIRPCRTGRVFPRIPRRFQGNGMLMPRPFYSRKASKRLIQRGDNLLRKLFSSMILAVDGTEQWVSAGSFESQYAELLKQLADRGFSAVCCSTVYIDEKLFRGSLEQYAIFNGVIERAAEEAGVLYVDLFTPLKEEVGASGWDEVYNKDHFHPNGNGYLLMADAISEAVKEATKGRTNAR